MSGDADSLSVNAGLCGVSTNSCSVKIAAFDRVMACVGGSVERYRKAPKGDGFNILSMSVNTKSVGIYTQSIRASTYWFVVNPDDKSANRDNASEIN